MKTLVLSLVVVTIVCLDFGYTLYCRKCNRTVCDLNGKCAEGEIQCYILQNNNDKNGTSAVQGCAENCPCPGPDQKVKCCSADNCNSYF